MGNKTSFSQNPVSTAFGTATRGARSTIQESAFEEHSDFEKRMTEGNGTKNARNTDVRSRRRSVSVHVRGIRRQSSMVHENLVKINMVRNIRSVYSGVDDTTNQLGEGTWGQVRLVTRRDDPTRKAAVKILQLSDDLDDNRLNELRSEITLLQKIDHAHIAKLYETFEEDGLNLYLVMEYLSGGELFDRVIELGYFKESKAADAVQQMVAAVKYLHNRGIVHRDIKLENFMFRSKDSDELVLIDFGLSTRFSPILNQDSKKEIYMKEMVGSSYYMAPEVMKRKYGRECDLWSIGVIAYMLLSGHPPFAGDTDAEIMRRVRRGVYNFNHSAFNKVTDNAKDFVSKLLKYEPSERMNADDALLHPWLSDYHKKLMQRRSQRRGSFIDSDVIGNLKNFVHTSRFKKIALQAVAYATPYEDIAELQQVFKDIDQDQDGYITLEELKAALKDNPHVDSAKIEEIFQAMDIDKLQKIHLNEFIAATMNQSLLKDEKILLEAFRKLDVNDCGEISISDLQDLLGRRFDRKQAAMMLQEFTSEAKKKGAKSLTKITQKDFIQAMRKMRQENTEKLIQIPTELDKEFQELEI